MLYTMNKQYLSLIIGTKLYFLLKSIYIKKCN